MAALGKFDAIANQIEQHLFQAQGIAAEVVIARLRCSDAQRDLFLLCVKRHDRGHLVEHVREAKWQLCNFNAPRFDLGQVEHIVDDRQQRPASDADSAHQLAGIGGQMRFFEQIRDADDRIHRRAQFMAHVGKEGALGQVGRVRLRRLPHQVLVQGCQLPLDQHAGVHFLR